MKKNITISLSPQIIEQLKTHVFYSPGATISAIVEESIILFLETKPNQKKSEQINNLRKGRPIKHG